GKSVREVVIEMGLLTGEQVDAILTPENFLKPRYTGKVYGPDDHRLPGDARLRALDEH
ncbi:aspartate ammonia-lyase, partial [Propionibacterium freudenreichii]|nr:aspartate ammonia-lyase [Propionibacterium freudenreichii]